MPSDASASASAPVVLVALAHFCEQTGPSIVFVSQAVAAADLAALDDDDAALTSRPGTLSAHQVSTPLPASTKPSTTSAAAPCVACHPSLPTSPAALAATLTPCLAAYPSLVPAPGSLPADLSCAPSTARPALISALGAEGPWIATARHPLRHDLYPAVKSACVRALSCEVTSNRAGPMLFTLDGPNGNPLYTIAHFFQLADRESRGNTRAFALLFMSDQGDHVVQAWDPIVRQFADIVGQLTRLADQVSTFGLLKETAPSELSPERFLKRHGNAMPVIKSLVDMVGVKSVFVSLHLHFAALIRRSGIAAVPELVPTDAPNGTTAATNGSVSSNSGAPPQSLSRSTSRRLSRPASIATVIAPTATRSTPKSSPPLPPTPSSPGHLQTGFTATTSDHVHAPGMAATGDSLPLLDHADANGTSHPRLTADPIAVEDHDHHVPSAPPSPPPRPPPLDPHLVTDTLHLLDLFQRLPRADFCAVVTHAVCGNQVIIRGAPSAGAPLVHAVARQVLPRGCAQPIAQADTYRDSWECNLLGVDSYIAIPTRQLRESMAGFCVVDVDPRGAACLAYQYFGGAGNAPDAATGNANDAIAPATAASTSAPGTVARIAVEMARVFAAALDAVGGTVPVRSSTESAAAAAAASPPLAPIHHDPNTRPSALTPSVQARHSGDAAADRAARLVAAGLARTRAKWLHLAAQYHQVAQLAAAATPPAALPAHPAALKQFFDQQSLAVASMVLHPVSSAAAAAGAPAAEGEAEVAAAVAAAAAPVPAPRAPRRAPSLLSLSSLLGSSWRASSKPAVATTAAAAGVRTSMIGVAGPVAAAMAMPQQAVDAAAWAADRRTAAAAVPAWAAEMRCRDDVDEMVLRFFARVLHRVAVPWTRTTATTAHDDAVHDGGPVVETVDAVKLSEHDALVDHDLADDTAPAAEPAAAAADADEPASINDATPASHAPVAIQIVPATPMVELDAVEGGLDLDRDDDTVSVTTTTMTEDPAEEITETRTVQHVLADGTVEERTATVTTRRLKTTTITKTSRPVTPTTSTPGSPILRPMTIDEEEIEEIVEEVEVVEEVEEVEEIEEEVVEEVIEEDEYGVDAVVDQEIVDDDAAAELETGADADADADAAEPEIDAGELATADAHHDARFIESFSAHMVVNAHEVDEWIPESEPAAETELVDNAEQAAEAAAEAEDDAADETIIERQLDETADEVEEIVEETTVEEILEEVVEEEDIEEDQETEPVSRDLDALAASQDDDAVAIDLAGEMEAGQDVRFLSSFAAHLVLNALTADAWIGELPELTLSSPSLIRDGDVSTRAGEMECGQNISVLSSFASHFVAHAPAVEDWIEELPELALSSVKFEIPIADGDVTTRAGEMAAGQDVTTLSSFASHLVLNAATVEDWIDELPEHTLRSVVYAAPINDGDVTTRAGEMDVGQDITTLSSFASHLVLGATEVESWIDELPDQSLTSVVYTVPIADGDVTTRAGEMEAGQDVTTLSSFASHFVLGTTETASWIGELPEQSLTSVVYAVPIRDGDVTTRAGEMEAGQDVTTLSSFASHFVLGATEPASWIGELPEEALTSVVYAVPIRDGDVTTRAGEMAAGQEVTTLSSFASHLVLNAATIEEWIDELPELTLQSVVYAVPIKDGDVTTRAGEMESGQDVTTLSSFASHLVLNAATVEEWIDELPEHTLRSIVYAVPIQDGDVTTRAGEMEADQDVTVLSSFASHLVLGATETASWIGELPEQTLTSVVYAVPIEDGDVTTRAGEMESGQDVTMLSSFASHLVLGATETADWIGELPEHTLTSVVYAVPIVDGDVTTRAGEMEGGQDVTALSSFASHLVLNSATVEEWIDELPEHTLRSVVYAVPIQDGDVTTRAGEMELGQDVTTLSSFASHLVLGATEAAHWIGELPELTLSSVTYAVPIKDGDVTTRAGEMVPGQDVTTLASFASHLVLNAVETAGWVGDLPELSLTSVAFEFPVRDGDVSTRAGEMEAGQDVSVLASFAAHFAVHAPAVEDWIDAEVPATTLTSVKFEIPIPDGDVTTRAGEMACGQDVSVLSSFASHFAAHAPAVEDWIEELPESALTSVKFEIPIRDGDVTTRAGDMAAGQDVTALASFAAHLVLNAPDLTSWIDGAPDQVLTSCAYVLDDAHIDLSSSVEHIEHDDAASDAAWEVVHASDAPVEEVATRGLEAIIGDEAVIEASAEVQAESAEVAEDVAVAKDIAAAVEEAPAAEEVKAAPVVEQPAEAVPHLEVAGSVTALAAAAVVAGGAAAVAAAAAVPKDVAPAAEASSAPETKTAATTATATAHVEAVVTQRKITHVVESVRSLAHTVDTTVVREVEHAKDFVSALRVPEPTMWGIHATFGTLVTLLASYAYYTGANYAWFLVVVHLLLWSALVRMSMMIAAADADGTSFQDIEPSRDRGDSHQGAWALAAKAAFHALVTRRTSHHVMQIIHHGMAATLVVLLTLLILTPFTYLFALLSVVTLLSWVWAVRKVQTHPGHAAAASTVAALVSAWWSHSQRDVAASTSAHPHLVRVAHLVMVVVRIAFVSILALLVVLLAVVQRIDAHREHEGESMPARVLWTLLLIVAVVWAALSHVAFVVEVKAEARAPATVTGVRTVEAK
ncbi:hypothetical protein GGF32_000957 [Allomyces javanicus]|nr:hypothetical protein GGF32_000957 [Allomyces javanicus]